MRKSTKELLTTEDVAKELGISKETARKLMVTGRLAYVPVGAGDEREDRRVRRETLDAFKKAEKRGKLKQEFADARAYVAASSGSDGPW